MAHHNYIRDFWYNSVKIANENAGFKISYTTYGTDYADPANFYHIDDMEFSADSPCALHNGMGYWYLDDCDDYHTIFPNLTLVHSELIRITW